MVFGNGLVSAWAIEIRKNNVNTMTNFYSKDAILLATYTNIILGQKGIREYFVDFLNKDDLQCNILSNYTQNYGRFQVSSGLYDFSFSQYGVKKIVHARYSYVIFDNKIINHHSSVLPEQL